jgi:hypothetical protein
MVALPYSQASTLFLNVALAHEMGHFAFQELNVAAQLSPSAISSVQAAVGKPLASLDLVWYKDRVLRWCEEVYCDLFALWLIGPSFSFSFIELFALARIAPQTLPDGTTLSPAASLATFDDSHPAPSFRLGTHVRFLADLGWWDKIKVGSSHYLRLLLDAEGLDRSSFSFVSQNRRGFESEALSGFFQIVPEIIKAVKDIFSTVPTELDSFETQREAIEEYLSYGVVPSRLVSGEDTLLPSAVALVNAAHLFYLEHLDRLIGKIHDAKTDCLECRALWAERVEMWTSKALEDLNF